MEHMSPYRRTLVLGSLFFVLWLIYLLQPILTPFLVGMAIAYLGDPLVDRLELKVGRTGGVVIVFLISMTLLFGGILFLVPMLVKEVSSLIRSLPVFVQWFQDVVFPILNEQFNFSPEKIDVEKLKGIFLNAAQDIGNSTWAVVKGLTSSGVAMAVAVANLALIPVVSFYLMRDWDILMAKLRDVLPRGIEPKTTVLASECDEVLSAFLRGQMLVMVALGIIYSLGLTFVGLDLALLIGMIAGLASIVPYLGFFVGIAAASVAAIIQFQEPFPLIYVAIVFGVGQMLEGMVLTPLLVGDRIGLHPVAVIFAILAGGQLFGFTGILLALPVAAVIMVFLRHWHEIYKDSEYYHRQAVGLDIEPPENDATDVVSHDESDES